MPRKILDLFAISDKCNGRLVVLVNDNKVDVEEDPEVHLLDPDVVAEVEVLLHQKNERIKITSEENQHRPCYRTLGEVSTFFRLCIVKFYNVSCSKTIPWLENDTIFSCDE